MLATDKGSEGSLSSIGVVVDGVVVVVDSSAFAVGFEPPPHPANSNAAIDTAITPAKVFAMPELYALGVT